MWNEDFEKYLIIVGSRAITDYTYPIEQLWDNIDYFRKCWENHLSAYKALLFLSYYLKGEYDI